MSQWRQFALFGDGPAPIRLSQCESSRPITLARSLACSFNSCPWLRAGFYLFAYDLSSIVIWLDSGQFSSSWAPSQAANWNANLSSLSHLIHSLIRELAQFRRSRSRHQLFRAQTEVKFTKPVEWPLLKSPASVLLSQDGLYWSYL